MHRFYSGSENVSQDRIIISDRQQLHHLKDVLRLEAGDEAAVFDDKGNVYQVEVESLSYRNVVLKIKDIRKSDKSKRILIAIGCAIPKKSKMDDIIDKLTQLGVDKIIPLITERVIVKLDKDKKSQRQKRWQKIALSASKQSQRNTVPVVEVVMDFEEIIKRAQDFDLKLIPNLRGERRTLKEALIGKKPKSVLVLIGPEGDFSPEEISMAIKAGFIPVTFGDFVFRVETACLYIASVLNYELG